MDDATFSLVCVLSVRDARIRVDGAKTRSCDGRQFLHLEPVVKGDYENGVEHVIVTEDATEYCAVSVCGSQ